MQLRIINITPVVKIRVKEMVMGLMPDVNYIRINKNGVVILKKNFWSFRKITTSVADLLLGILPELISEFTVNTKDGVNYQRLFNEHIAAIMSLRSYSNLFDVCDYVWKEYNRSCVIVPEIICRTDVEKKFVLEKSNLLPVKVPFSSIRVKELIQNTISVNPDGVGNRFKQSLERMRNNLPVKIIVFRQIFGNKPIITATIQ